MFQPGPWHDRLVTSFATLHDLTGKVAVVTGGSRGIGRAIVQTLAEAGADVVIASRKLDACEAAAEQVRASTGRRAVAIACHVGRWGDCDRLIAETLGAGGQAGRARQQRRHVAAVREPRRGERGTVRQDAGRQPEGPVPAGGAGRHAHGREGDGGSIINIGTTASLTASVGELPYACAKAGLNALTVGLAEAFAPRVRVNAILPGPFRTDISRGWAPPEGAEVPFVPLGRMGDPAELAPLALHLASAASSYTTGAIIRVDGGVTRKV